MSCTQSQLKEFSKSPAKFRSSLLVDADSGPQRFGEICEDWQKQDFEALDPAWLHLAGRSERPKHQRAYLERPRGHSKTTDTAIMILWAIAFSKRQLSGVCAAADRKQARLIRDAILKLVRINNWLSDVIDVQDLRVINTRTSSELQVLSSDAPTSFGLTPDFVVIDELTHWSSRDLWDSLLSASAKRSHCLLSIISNAGFTDSWQGQLYNAVQDDSRWCFRRLNGPVASWISKDDLEEQRRLLPDPAYRRLWLNEWSSGAGDALRGEDVTNAIKLNGPFAPQRGYQFSAGLDLGISHDHSALCVVGKNVGFTELIEAEKPQSYLNEALIDLGMMQPKSSEIERFEFVEGDGKIRLSYINSWKPPAKGKIDLELVENAVYDVATRFQCPIFFDPHQATYLAQRLRKRGVKMIQVDFSSKNLTAMATQVIEAFNNQAIELFDDELLCTQLRQLRIIDKANGYRLESPRGKGGHGDRATAFSLAMLGLKKASVNRLERPLLGDGIQVETNFETETMTQFERMMFG